MKRYLILCVILTVSSFAGKSQTIDTLCLPVPQVQKLLIAGKQKFAQDTLISILRSDISILSQSVRAYQIKDSAQQQINLTYQAMIGTMKDQRAILEGQIMVLNKEVRRWKRKTTWTAVGGIVLTSLATFLFLTK